MDVVEDSATGLTAAEAERLEELQKRKEALKQRQREVVERKREQGAGASTSGVGGGAEQNGGEVAVSATPNRENMVQGAVQFFTSPAVRKSPRADAIAFLKKKGLTDAEIEAAQKRADSILASTPSAAVDAPSVPTSAPVGGPIAPAGYPPQAQGQYPAPYPPPYPYPYPPPVSTGMAQKQSLLAPALVTAGVVTAVWTLGRLAEKYIGPMLFGLDDEKAEKEKKEKEEEKERLKREEEAAATKRSLDEMKSKLDRLEVQVLTSLDAHQASSSRSAREMEARMSALLFQQAVARAVAPSTPAPAAYTQPTSAPTPAATPAAAPTPSVVNHPPPPASSVTAGAAPATLPQPSHQSSAATPASSAPRATSTSVGVREAFGSEWRDETLAKGQELVEEKKVAPPSPYTEYGGASDRKGKGKLVEEEQEDVSTSRVVSTPTSTPVPPPSQPHSTEFLSMINNLQQGITPTDIKNDIDDSPTNQTNTPPVGSRPAPVKPWLKRKQERMSQNAKQAASTTNLPAPQSLVFPSSNSSNSAESPTLSSSLPTSETKSESAEN